MLRIKQEGKLTEIKYNPKRPTRFPRLNPGQRFDLWVVTDKYTFPFLGMHPDALTVSGWRIGADERPFDLKYMEFRLMRPDVTLVYYMIYQLADGAETPIWIETDETLDAYRN